MITIEVDAKQLKQLREACGRSKKKFPKELAAAINQVAKKTKIKIGRDVRATVAMPKEEAERPLAIKATATESSLRAIVTLRKTKRLGLRHFGARQDGRGVSYKIEKSGGRKRIPGGFQGPRPGVMKISWRGNVFRRTSKARLPIIHVRGVSAYGVYTKNDLSEKQVEEINTELQKQIKRRIELNILRAEGLVKK